MTGIVERLRNVQTFIGVAELRIEAADEIERLRKALALALEPTCPHGLPVSENCRECGDD